MASAYSNDSRKCILVVDDDPVVRQMLVRVLADSGYRTAAAATGGEMLETLAGAAPIDLALIDLDLPDESGWALLAAMRRQCPGLAAIIITAWPNQQSAAKEAGAEACFEKPLDFPELLNAIARVVGRTSREAFRAGIPAAGNGQPSNDPVFPSS